MPHTREIILRCIPSRFRFRMVDLKNRLWGGFHHPSFSQYGEDRALTPIFQGRKNGFYVDVGAHHPLRYSNTALLHRAGWRGINIDPNPETIALFRARRPRDINLVCGVSDVAGDREYFTFSDPAVNTFDPAQAAQWKGKSWIAYLGARIVPALPLREILSAHLPAGCVIDLLNVDAEGCDLAVLESNDWDRFRPRVVVAESASFRADRPREDTIYSFLFSKSYALIAHMGPSLIFKSTI